MPNASLVVQYLPVFFYVKPNIFRGWQLLSVHTMVVYWLVVVMVEGTMTTIIAQTLAPMAVSTLKNGEMKTNRNKPKAAKKRSIWWHLPGVLFWMTLIYMLMAPHVFFLEDTAWRFAPWQIGLLVTCSLMLGIGLKALFDDVVMQRREKRETDIRAEALGS